MQKMKHESSPSAKQPVRRARKWTVKAAREWVKRVDQGLETLGLKYASAKSFLRGKGKG